MKLKLQYFYRSLFSVLYTVFFIAIAGTAFAADTWMTRIGHIQINYHEGGIVQNQAGGYALAGTHHRDDGTTSGGLALLDVDGNLYSAKQYRPGRAASISYIDNVQGGYLLVMQTASYNEPVWVARVHEDGSIATNATGGYLEFYLDMPIEFSTVIGNMAYLVTDSFTVAATQRNGVGVVKINLDTFNIEWTKVYSYDLTDMNVRSVKAGPKGGPIIVGWTYPSNDLDSYILEISADQGDVQSFHVIGRPFNDKARDIAVLADGGLILGGDGTNSNNDDRYDVWVVKINPDWSIGWQTMFEGPDTDWCNSISVLADNSIVVGATSRSWSSNGDYDIWGIRIKDKKNGPAVKWQKHYWTVDRDETYDQVSTQDGGVVLVAEHRTYTGDSGSILVKTDKRGNVYTTDANGQQVDCPCETKTRAEMIETYATISDMEEFMTVYSQEETGFVWEETSPVELFGNIPVGAICN